MFPTVTRSRLSPRTCMTEGQKRCYPGAAALKILKRRRATVVQIGKITNTMKVVAASKLGPANEKAEKTKAFFHTLHKGFEPLKSEEEDENVERNTLLIVIYTDKGLCGPTNNAISRMLMKEDLSASTVIVFGEKGCGAFSQGRWAKKVPFSVHPSMKTNLSYAEISAVVAKALEVENFDVIRIIHNRMNTPASSIMNQIFLPSLKTLDGENARNFLLPYEIEATSSDELLANLNEFHISAALNYACAQNLAVELFSRRNSMENATKNSKEVDAKITLKYNKARQAMITTELGVIVSGAAAVSEMK